MSLICQRLLITMEHNKFSSDLAAKCLALIREQGPVRAITLADKLGIIGDRETKRRHIRAIVQYLRNDCGIMLVADLMHGYFVTDDKKVWQDYLDGRQIGAKKILGVTHKQLRMAIDSSGQGILFVPPYFSAKTSAGVKN